MVLNEADSGLPVVEGPGPGRHHRCPGSTALAPTLVSANKQPLEREQKPHSGLQESGLGLYPLCAGLWGSSPTFWGQLELPLHS